MIDTKNLKVGDKVVCIIDSKASIKVGKEYTIKSIYDDDLGNEISVVNEKGILKYYSIFRFVTKSKFREYLIDDIQFNTSIINCCKEVSRIIEMRKDNVISFHESLEKLYELSEKLQSVEIDESILEDINLSRLDEEKTLVQVRKP